MDSPRYEFGQRLLHWWAIATALATYVLVWSGGLVTSKGVGMAVPDWPTTFGYNMFLFPVSKWVGGIFYEHSHRLIGSGVGLMVIGLVVGAFIVERRKWVKVFSVVLLVAVIIQGVLGGLRVVLVKDHIGILHAMLAQSFFSALVVFCVVTSGAFVTKRWALYDPSLKQVRWAFSLTLLVFFQLMLGATMRHEHIGLAVPDFPLAYGQVVPDTSPEAMVEINAIRHAEGEVPLKPVYIWIHMMHRVVAVLLGVGIIAYAVSLRRAANPIRRMGAIWAVMVLVQFFLGAWTVWSDKAADVATMHMALGALVLAWGVVLTFRLIVGSRAAAFAAPDEPIPRSSVGATA